MTNALYPKFREALGLGQINLLTDTIKAMLVDTADYTYAGTHQYLSDIPVAAREEISAALTTKTWTTVLDSGTYRAVFDADDVSFPGATGDPVEALVLFKDTGTASTSPLIAYWDTATGLPVTLNGGPVGVSWPNDARKIFDLS